MSDTVKIVHHGRGGYVELDGVRYTIDHVAGGVFCIHFPAGNTHAKLAEHRGELTAFAESRDPQWYVGG